MKFSFTLPSFESARKRSLYFWMRHYKKMFTLLFLLVTGFVAFQWYRDLYQYRWSEAERKSYLEQTVKETAFQEKKFLEVVDRLERDRVLHMTEKAVERDLFAGAREKKP